MYREAVLSSLVSPRVNTPPYLAGFNMIAMFLTDIDNNDFSSRKGYFGIEDTVRRY